MHLAPVTQGSTDENTLYVAIKKYFIQKDIFQTTSRQSLLSLLVSPEQNKRTHTDILLLNRATLVTSTHTASLTAAQHSFHGDIH